MNTQILELTRQLNNVCTASNLDNEMQAAALQSCFSTIRTNSPLPLVDYDYGGLRIEINRMVATLNGKPIAFTGNEWKIMVALIKANGGKVSKNDLAKSVYGADDREPDSNTLEVFLSHIRSKVGTGVILTYRGLGYVLASRAF
jgi:DNA-binding response OmpR family regulator